MAHGAATVQAIPPCVSSLILLRLMLHYFYNIACTIPGDEILIATIACNTSCNVRIYILLVQLGEAYFQHFTEFCFILFLGGFVRECPFKYLTEF